VGADEIVGDEVSVGLVDGLCEMVGALEMVGDVEGSIEGSSVGESVGDTLFRVTSSWSGKS